MIDLKTSLQLKRLSKLVIICIGIIIIFLIITFFLLFNSSSQGSYTKPTAPATQQSPQNINDNQSTKFAQNVASRGQSSGLPVLIQISKINVTATITYVGITSNGAMGVPKGPTDVVWYNLGPRPGENGSAVIAGHYGRWKTGEGSVFDNLHTLSKGDKLYIKNDKGVLITFVVRESKSYDPNADASDVFTSKDGKPHLNLITCEGIWNKFSKSYSKRLVVFTDKE